ncbi:glycosyl hydrolase family 28 protein [Segatella bryantii]|uniref:glycoside hydrolase family 28 protein n=1 Tax=Segatella bryantii TaxID=77095 RepID=UPI001EDA827C|nr:glycosyl hydrolase family 28 protein [Segatella bryantii]UKK72234.1 glycosyl hydrolase family 28 protein [Segatella bryantii]
MKLRIVLTTLLLALVLQLQAQWNVPTHIEPIQAPFDMPQLYRPTFAAYKVNIRKMGAKIGKLSTKAIQRAIDKVSNHGGGHVIIPAGKWYTGRLILKSHVDLHLETGAELHFSGRIADYLPVVATRNEGVDLYSLGAMIYANGTENIAVTGKGKLVAPDIDCELMQHTMQGVSEELQQMKMEERIFDGQKKHTIDNQEKAEICLPTFFGPVNSRNVLLEGVTLERSVFWNIVPVYCENIIIRDVTVNSFGHARTDGIDFDSSRNGLVEYTTLDCGDDCFTLKSGRGMDGVKRNRPTENIVIRHCKVVNAAGGFTIGSETAAMIRNVYVYDIEMEHPRFALYFKSRRPRGGGAENVWMENIHAKQTKYTAIKWDLLGSPEYVGKLAERFAVKEPNALTPKFRNIHFKNISIDQCPTLIKMVGLPEQPIEQVTYENVKGSSMETILQDAGTVSFK